MTVFGMAFQPIFGSDISTEKSSYNEGDIIKISGTVSSVDEGKFIILQIINPDESDIVTADQFLPSNDGSFSKSYPAKGPNWTLDGVYTVKIFYEKWTETTFQFQNESGRESPSNSDSKKKPIMINLLLPILNLKIRSKLMSLQKAPK